MNAKHTHSNVNYYTDLSVGEILRRARLQMGLSVHDVEHMLRIRVEHINALEQSDFNALPGPAYVVGFVRSYAEFLNLDGGRVVDLLKVQSREGLGTIKSVNFVEPSTESRVPSVPIVGAALAGLFMLIVIWIAYQNMRLSGIDEYPAVPEELQALASFDKMTQESAIPSVDAEEPEGPPAPVQQPVSKPVAAPPVQVVLKEDSWIELRNPEGLVVDARLFRAGEAIALDTPVDEFGNSYAITMGNAGGVEIQVDGKSVGSLGQTNQVRRNIPLNPKTLRLLIEN